MLPERSLHRQQSIMLGSMNLFLQQIWLICKHLHQDENFIEKKDPEQTKKNEPNDPQVCTGPSVVAGLTHFSACWCHSAQPASAVMAGNRLREVGQTCHQTGKATECSVA